MRRMRWIVLGFGLAFVFVLGACGDDESGSTPTTGTTVSPAATSEGSLTATATATYAPPPTPSTAGLPGDIAAAIDAVRAHDAARLESLITTTMGPCVPNPAPGILRPPACPAGVAEGTLVPALVVAGCPDDNRAGYIDPTITYRITSFDPGPLADLFIGVVGVDGPVRFAALWGAEKISWLGFDADGKLIGAGGGGDCPAYELRPRLANATWLAGPAWVD